MTAPSAGLTYGRPSARWRSAAGSASGWGSGGPAPCCAPSVIPERTVRGALVAGTNGKGSVLALADAALRAAGYRVGATPKPHLVTYRERIQVDGRPIAAGRLRPARRARPGGGRPGRAAATASRPSSSC